MMAQLPPPFLTCEAVLTETLFLLKKYPPGTEAVLTWVRDGLIQIPFQIKQEITNVKNLMLQYRSVPMSFADACLVRMSEMIMGSRVMTLDNDFLIYRKDKNQRIPVVMPSEGNIPG